MNDFIKHIKQIVEELKTNSVITVNEFVLAPSLTREKILAKEDEYSLKFSPEIKQFYENCGGLTLRWRVNDNSRLGLQKDDLVEGSINILPIDTLIMGFDGRHWLNELWSDDMSEDEKDFKRKFKIFDYFGMHNIESVCLKIRNNTITDDLWTHHLDYGYFKMDLSLERYLQLLISSRGIWGWQFFYADLQWSINHLFSLKHNGEIILTAFSKLFPEDYETIKEFEKNYHARVTKE